MKSALKILFLTLAAHVALAAQNKPAVQLQFEELKLSNGLQVLLHEDHKLPIVAVDLWYHVGPAKERAGRTGFAHLFEHMMFEGSEHVGEKAHFKYVEAAGGTDINGTTSWDRTNYFETVPSNQLEVALWLESDRMGFLLDTLDRAKLTNQRDVVRNERRQSTEGQPYGIVNEEVYHQLFPKGHPYYAAVIGSHADVESARLADVRDFFKDYYSPNNATLAIAGDYDAAAIRSLLEKYFGPIPRGPEVQQSQVTTPPITHEKRITVTDTVQLPKVILAWLAPPIFAPGNAEMNITAYVLGAGDSSRLYRELVYKQQIAQSAACYLESAALTSNLQCEIVAKPGIPPEKLETEAEKVIDGFATGGPTAEELQWSRNKIETPMIMGLQRMGGFGGVADQLNYYNQYTGDPGYLPKDLARYDALTPDAVRAAASTHLGKDQRVVVYGVPGKKILYDVPRSPDDTDANVKIEPVYTPEFEAAQAWRKDPPKPGPQRPLVLPQPNVFTLTNGLTVSLVERHDLPIVSAEFLVVAGAATNPVNKPGLAGITAAMLSQGTTKRNAQQIADAASLLGTNLDVDSGPDTAQLSISLLSKFVRPGLELMADSIQHPSFPAADLERVRSRRLTSLIQEQDDPIQLALRAGVLNLFGPTSPYGYDALGTTHSLKAATRDDLVAFYQAHYGPKTSLLELTGDVTPAEAHKLAEEAFGNWTSTVAMPNVPQPPDLPERKILILDKPGAPQTALLTFGTGAARNSPDYPALMVMNNMLGGLFSSRINLNLREEHGYTYGAFSFYWFYRGLGPFIAGAEVRGDVTAPAAEQLFKELDQIHTKPLSDSELRMGKDSLIRSLPGSFESAEGVNRQLGDLWLFSLPLDSYTALPTRIEAVTSADAARVANKYVRPDNVLLIAVGDKAKIEGGLKSVNLGPVNAWQENEASTK